MLRVQSTVRPEYYQDYLMQIAASKIIPEFAEISQ